uniref:Sulfatase N-terminal domain-containing protein n=1 Tax=Amphora coffeiformis TaxID=265554 RepID=A0A7S3PA16_9STRA
MVEIEPRRPNILLITTDDMNWDSVGVYGCPVQDTTPNIDRLAWEGIQFEYGFVNIAVCTPSRHVILSGSHTHQTMTRGFTELEPVGPTLPDVLRQHGYYTNEVNKQQKPYNWHASFSERETAWGRSVSYQKQLMRNIISKAGDRPWLTVFNLNDPHRAFHGAPDEGKYGPALYTRFSTPSRVYNATDIVVPGFLPDLSDVRIEIAQYYSSVRRADDNVGVILEEVERAGQTNDTIVVFLSDHGMSNPFAKLSCYPNGLRVPFLVRYPGFIPAGTRDRVNMISTVDLAPTLLELAQLEMPPTMAGRSFLPLLQRNLQEGRDHVIGYYYRNVNDVVMYPMFVVQTRDWVYIYSPWVDGVKQARNSDFGRGLTWQAMAQAADLVPSIKERVDFHKFRIRHELYSIRQDPHAYLNVAAKLENSQRVKDMRKWLVDWMEETDHPAKDLMKDPDNEALIADYMEWEEQNAIEQNLQENLTTTAKTSTATRTWGNCLVSLSLIYLAALWV